MSELLRHAGAPTNAIAQVKSIVDTCRVCRLWARPTDKSMTATRLSTGFNEIVEWDILFYDDLMISHLCDQAIRWSAGGILPGRLANDIISNITTHWFRPYGPMRVLVTDQEAALKSEATAQWLDRWAVQLKTKEPGAHANTVERHHE